MEKYSFNRVKKKKKQWKKPQEGGERRNPSSRTDRHAIDVACTENSNKSQFPSLYVNDFSSDLCSGNVCRLASV